MSGFFRVPCLLSGFSGFFLILVVLFVGAHCPDRGGTPCFPDFRGLGSSGRSADRVFRSSGPVRFPVFRSRPFRCSGSGRGRHLPAPGLAVSAPAADGIRLRVFGLRRLSFSREPFSAGRRSGGGSMPPPSLSRRRQRLSPSPEIRWRCMRERSLSTFICATSSSS